MQAVSDEQLIEWVARGDASCLGTLFERHNRGVYQYCRQLTRHSAQAEDLVQEVFLKMLRKASTFRGQGSFKAWMFNIARNITFDHMRKRKRQGTSEAIEETADQFANHRSAEQAAAGVQNVGILAKALSNLPEAVQEVIWLGRFEFDSYEELAQALGCKPATARVRMHRAMQQLNLEFRGAAKQVGYRTQNLEWRRRGASRKRHHCGRQWWRIRYQTKNAEWRYTDSQNHKIDCLKREIRV